jgi:hypothetical protein
MSTLEELSLKNEELAVLVGLQRNGASVEFFEPVSVQSEIGIFDGVEWIRSINPLGCNTMIFVEADISKIKSILDTQEFQDFLVSKNCYIVHKMVFPCPVGGKSFEVFYKDSPTPFFATYVENLIRFQSLHLEGKNLGLAHMQNMIETLLTIDTVSCIESIHGIPACPWVVVGGATLSEDDLAALQSLKMTHYVIAAGSATKNLLEKNIRPDFATIVDPHPKEEGYIEHDIPTFFQLRVATAFLQRSRGKKILSGMNNLFPIEQQLLNVAGIETGWLDGGFDTVNFSAAIAQFFQATHIRYVGVSEGRGTLNDLLSRLELSKESFRSSNVSKLNVLEKHWCAQEVVVNRHAVIDFLLQTLEAEDTLDLDRLGWKDGYIRPLQLYAEKQIIPIEPLLNCIQVNLKKPRD